MAWKMDANVWLIYPLGKEMYEFEWPTPAEAKLRTRWEKKVGWKAVTYKRESRNQNSRCMTLNSWIKEVRKLPGLSYF